LQLNPQLVPLHVAVEFAGGVHAVHDPPQLLMLVLSTQAPLQRWKPPLQVNPQLVPSHVADELAGGVHGEHELPHDAVLLLLSHAAPHV
jgi:hypothetical protein